MNARIASTITTIAVYLIAAYPTTPFDYTRTGDGADSCTWSDSRYVMAPSLQFRSSGPDVPKVPAPGSR